MRPELLAERPDLRDWITSAGYMLPEDIFAEQLLTLDVTGDDVFAAHDLYADLQPNGTAPPEEPAEDVDSWTPINLAHLAEHPPVEPTLGAVGIVYPGKRHVFSGPQESAKTLAAYAIGLEVVRRGGTLILLDFEMGAWDARNLLRELGATPADFARIHYFAPSEPATDKTMPRLLELRPTLVIVDAAAGAYDLQSLDDNKRQDVERFTRLYVRAFWKADVATIVLDHVVKNTDTRGPYAVGSERKVGGADVHLGFDVITPIKRGGHGLYKISTHKDRGGFLKRGTLANLELSSDPDTHAISWEFKAAVETDDDNPELAVIPTNLMEKISRYLETLHEPVPRNTILRDVKGNDRFKRHAIEILTARGHVEETDGPRGAKLLTSLVSYRQTDEPNDPGPTSADPGRGRGQPPRPTSAPPLRGAEVAGVDVTDVKQLHLGPAEVTHEEDPA